MTQAKTVRLIYGILLSIALVAAGLCFMSACLAIYQSGDRPFSREAVALHFSQISVPVYIALAMAIGGFILNFILPADKTKKKHDKNYAFTLQRLWAKRDISYCGPTLLKAIKYLQKQRKVHWTISIALLAIGSMAFFLYALNPANFPTDDITGAMAQGTKIMLLCLIVPFGYAVFSAYFSRASQRKEVELVKTIAVCDEKPSAPAVKDWKNPLRWVLLCVAIGIIIFGYFTGGTNDVLTKAVNICTECVGLG